VGTGKDRLFSGIVGGLVLGALVGIAIGDLVRPLTFVASGFIKLLQINVLPYLLGSIIASLGGRGPSELRLIARYGVSLLAIVWSIGLAFVVLSPLSLPPWTGAGIFGEVAPAARIEWLDLYIPSNLFRALSNNLIPAVVLFAVLTGLAVGQMSDERKAPFLRVLDGFNEAMARVSDIILRLTPIGLFAIAAVTAGETRVDQLLRLQLWLHLYVGGALLMTFWVLPRLVARFTPIPYGRFLAAVRSPIVTAAAAGDALVVLPLITEVSKSLLKERGASSDDADRAIAIAAPLLYNFPHAAKVLSLMFLPFGAWYAGVALGGTQMILLCSAGLLSVFGSINAAVPFLLDVLRLPADLYNIFEVSSVVNARVGSMTAAMHVSALSIIVACALLGQARFSWHGLLRFMAIAIGIVLAFLLGTRAIFTWMLPPARSGLETLNAFRLRPPLVPIVNDTGLPATPPARGDRLMTIRARGVLRVGYFPDAMPWTFVNADGALVGYDIEAAHRLAAELGLSVCFVPTPRPAVPVALSAGRIDIVMSGYLSTVHRAELSELSRPYALEHIGFLVRDHMRSRFATMETLRGGRALVIAIPPLPEAQALIARLLPQATARTVDVLDQAIDQPGIDAVLMSTERASYWSRVHPKYAAVQPSDLDLGLNVVYTVPLGEPDLRNLVDVWIETRRASGDLDEAYAYWVRGHALTTAQPRWSLWRDVMGRK
jgi:Na+/H+-dicarboxylate symporter/ABC-type amino acid transport substrate-binding protein